MAQDSDVARVVAALKTPGLRYRNFANAPLREPARATETGASLAPRPGAVLQGGHLASDAPPDRPVPAMPAAAGYPDGCSDDAAPGKAFSAPGFASAPTFPPNQACPPARPSMVFGHPAGGQGSHGLLAGFSGPAPLPALAEPVPSGYRLLEAIGHPQGVFGTPAVSPGSPASHPGHGLGHAGGPHPPHAPQATTMQRFGLMPPGARTPDSRAADLQPDGRGPSWDGRPGPDPAGFGHWPDPMPASAPLPAALVSLPLAEVMRLVAIGAPVVASPFAAFRVPAGATHAR